MFVWVVKGSVSYNVKEVLHGLVKRFSKLAKELEICPHEDVLNYHIVHVLGSLFKWVKLEPISFLIFEST